MSLIADQGMLEDESLELILSALDVDGDTLSFSSYTENENIILDVVGNDLDNLKSRLFWTSRYFYSC